MFFKVYNWFGESCEKRSAKSLADLMIRCFKEWQQPNRTDYDCQLWGLPNVWMVPNHVNDQEDAFFDGHPECKWQAASIRREITMATIQSTIDFIYQPVEHH